MTETPISVERKKPGRPPTGCDPLVQVRMPADVIQAINRWAGKFVNLDRSAAIRALVELGLHAGRRKDHVFDPKGYRQHEHKAPLAKRRRPPPAASAPLLRLVRKVLSTPVTFFRKAGISEIISSSMSWSSSLSSMVTTGLCPIATE